MNDGSLDANGSAAVSAPTDVTVFEVHGFRCLRRAHWAPRGVSALVGANGSGKTTLLSLPAMCAGFVKRGVTATAGRFGGAYGIRAWGQDEPTEIRVSMGSVVWQMALHEHEAGLKVQDRVVIDEASVEPSSMFHRGGTALAGAIDTHMGRLLAEGDERLRPADEAIAALLAYRHYQNPHIWALRTQGSQQGSDVVLHPTGQNAFDVLRNWSAGQRADRQRHAFVVETMREAFPGQFEDLEFQVAGTTVTVRFFGPGSDRPVAAFLAPQGMLAGLLHAAAVASADDGGIVAIDEFENSLHPLAIRALIEAFRARALEKHLTVVLATHSPVVLTEFRQCPESVLVMDPSEPELPAPLTQLRDREWLAHFSLGELYAHEEFGAPGSAR
jgi:predicted ATPase